MTNGISEAEEAELRLENRILRQRVQIEGQRAQIDQLSEDAACWRNCYENALHYLAVLQPNLAEIAEDDLFRIWKASL